LIEVLGLLGKLVLFIIVIYEGKHMQNVYARSRHGVIKQRRSPKGREHITQSEGSTKETPMSDDCVV
jgi:hypothetical protein